MGKRRLTGLALIIIGVAIYMIKVGLSTIFIKPISKLTGFAISKIQSIDSAYIYPAGFVLIVLGILLILFEKQGEKQIRKIVGK